MGEESTPTLTQLVDALDEMVNHHTRGKDDPLRIPRWKSERIAEIVHGIACDWANIAIQSSGGSHILSELSAAKPSEDGLTANIELPPGSTRARSMRHHIQDKVDAMSDDQVRSLWNRLGALKDDPPPPATDATEEGRRWWIVSWRGPTQAFTTLDAARRYTKDAQIDESTIVEFVPADRAQAAEKLANQRGDRLQEEWSRVQSYRDHVDKLMARAESAEARVRELEAAARSLCDLIVTAGDEGFTLRRTADIVRAEAVLRAAAEGGGK